MLLQCYNTVAATVGRVVRRSVFLAERNTLLVRRKQKGMVERQREEIIFPTNFNGDKTKVNLVCHPLSALSKSCPSRGKNEL
jgi:hypothetical protein